MQATISRPRMLAWLAALMPLLGLGCGNTAKHPGMNPVRGAVLAASGQPAAGANLAFHVRGGDPAATLLPQATTGADGSFVLTSQTAGDGAPEGEYSVTIVWPAMTAEGDRSGPDRLNGRFGNPRTTPFHVSVKPGDNALEPFRLK